MKQKISITINEKTLKDIDSIIDNIYIRNRSQAIELLVSSALGENKVAVILSGGSEDQIKISESEFRPTARINGLHLIEHNLCKLKESGFKKIHIIARKQVINRIFSIVQNGSRYGVDIEYIEELSSRGTADSLRILRGKITTNFLVLYGDIYFDELNLEDLWNEHLKQSGTATLLLTTTPTPSKKGVVRIEGSKILEFLQKPKQSNIYLGFSSMFAAQPELLEYEGDSLELDVFPKIASRRLLNGFWSTTKVLKIHDEADLDVLKKQAL